MVRLSWHAMIQLERRGLAVTWVEAAVRQPDWTAADPDPALTRSYKAIEAAGGRILRVVHRCSGDDILVVTAHFDRGARR